MNAETTRRLQLALRVLTTMGEGRPCDSDDERELRRIAAGLMQPEMQLDDLACAIVHRERSLLALEPRSEPVRLALVPRHGSAAL